MIFVDSSAFAALKNHKDENHEKAIHFKNEAIEHGEKFITSDYVLDESYTIIRFRANHKKAVEFGDEIRNSKLISLYFLEQSIIEDAWEIFKKYEDKTFSFTDCTSFALIEKLKIKKAFTFDHHFAQAGYQTVPYLTARECVG